MRILEATFYGVGCLRARSSARLRADLRNLGGSHGPGFSCKLHPQGAGKEVRAPVCGPLWAPACTPALPHSLRPPSTCTDVSGCGCL